MMKKMIFLLVLLMGSVVLLSGCEGNANDLSFSRGAGLVDTAAERHRRIAAILDINLREAQDDWDEFWLFDTNCKMTMWEVSIGNN